jgi:rod shape-determining protein MreD
MVNKLDLSRYIIGGLLLVFYHIIIGPRISIAGYQADLTIIFTIWIALIHGVRSGLYFGFAAGILIGVMNPPELGWSCLLLALAGYVSGTVGQKLEIDPLPMKALVLLIAAFCFNLLFIIFTKFELVFLNLPFVLTNTLFSAIYTTLLGAALFYLIRYRYVIKDLI